MFRALEIFHQVDSAFARAGHTHADGHMPIRRNLRIDALRWPSGVVSDELFRRLDVRVRYLLRRGELRATKVAGRVLISSTDLDAWLDGAVVSGGE